VGTVIFTMLLVSWGNYLERVIIHRFSGLMSNNSLEISLQEF